MARRHILALIVAVLSLHLAFLDWMGRSLQSTASVLTPMAEPLLTREIRQTPPPAPVAKNPVPNRPAALSEYAVTATKSVANDATSTTPTTPVQAPKPEQVTEETAAKPELPQIPSPETTPPTAEASDWPVNTRLSYDVTGFFRGPLVGNAKVEWLREAQTQGEGAGQDKKERYQVNVVIDLGLIGSRITSQGVIENKHLQPRAYEEKNGPNLRSLVLEPHRIRLQSGEWVDRPPQVQDTASQFVELAHRFTQQPELLTPGTAVPVWLARPGGIDEWVYDVQAAQTLHSKHLGDVPAFHLKPRPLAKPRGPMTVDIWFAPSLHYLPVRIRLNLGPESWLDLLVEKVER